MSKIAEAVSSPDLAHVYGAPAAIIDGLALFFKLLDDRSMAKIDTVKADIKTDIAIVTADIKVVTADIAVVKEKVTADIAVVNENLKTLDDDVKELKKSTAELFEKFQTSIVEKIEDNSKLLLETTKREATEKALRTAVDVLSVSPAASSSASLPRASTSMHASPPK